MIIGQQHAGQPGLTADPAIPGTSGQLARLDDYRPAAGWSAWPHSSSCNTGKMVVRSRYKTVYQYPQGYKKAVLWIRIRSDPELLPGSGTIRQE